MIESLENNVLQKSTLFKVVVIWQQRADTCGDEFYLINDGLHGLIK